MERYLENKDARGGKIVSVRIKIMIDIRRFLETSEPPHSRTTEGKVRMLDLE